MNTKISRTPATANAVAVEAVVINRGITLGKAASLLSSALLVPLIFGPLAVVHAQEVVDATETLPQAKPGECYAKVIIPAEYSTQQETVVVQEATERVETIPAQYETTQQSVVVKDAAQDLRAVPAVFTKSSEQIEVSPERSEWVNTTRKSIPASPSMLDAIIRSGVDLSTVSGGVCFREYYTPAEFKTESEEVLVRDSSERVVISPAKYDTVEERVIVKEASTQLVDVPAVYKTEKQQVLVELAKTVWKQGRGLVERIDNTTGEIMCLVEIPAVYQTLTKTVMETPASSKSVQVPAVYKTVKVQRLITPATEKRIPVPAKFETFNKRIKVADAGFYWLKKGEAPSAGAQYTGQEVCQVTRPAKFQTVSVERLATPASVKVNEIAAKYETVAVSRIVTPAGERRVSIPEKTKVLSRRIEVSPSRLEWRKVLCETNTTIDLVTRIQQALKREGFDPGLIDGVIGTDTKRALDAYQIKNSLNRGGLTYQTMEALKVAPGN